MTKNLPQTSKNDPQNRFQSGLGLEGIGDLAALLEAPKTQQQAGSFIELDLNLIDEDPKQPRTKANPGFSEESLEELAASIRLRGVKTPISVRNNPEKPGRFLINHGARRFRASKRAEKTSIPAFLDNDYTDSDQIIENIQRNELTAREIADFIGRQRAKGVKKGDIAKAISKSPAFVTQHITLLDLPDPIAKAFNTERVKDVTVINELVTAFKENPEAVKQWLAEPQQEITRGSVKLLREFIEAKGKETSSTPNDLSRSRKDEEKTPEEKQGDKPLDPEKRKTETLKRAIVQVRHNGKSARLILTRRPSAKGIAWLKYDDGADEFEANLAEVQLLAVMEGQTYPSD